jgi:hypothetical protein
MLSEDPAQRLAIGLVGMDLLTINTLASTHLYFGCCCISLKPLVEENCVSDNNFSFADALNTCAF